MRGDIHEGHAAIFEGSPFAMALMTMDSRVVDANQAFLELMGGSREAIVGRTVVELGIAPAADVQGMGAALRRDGAVRDAELSRTALDGRPLVVSLSLTPIAFAGDEYVLAVYRDITERKRAEAAAQEERAKLDTALKNMTDAVYVFDADGNLVDFNDAFVTFHRFASRDECVASLRDYPHVTEVFHPDGRLAAFEGWPTTRALRGEIGIDEEFTVRRTDTGETWVGSFSFSPLTDEAGEVSGAVVVARDISERKQTEHELRESEELFRSLFETSPQAVFLTAPDGSIASANRAACEMFERTVGELRKLGRSGVLDARDPRLALALEERENAGRVQAVELTAVRRDGEPFPVEVDSIILSTEPPRSFVMIRDITDRKRAEDALRQSEVEKRTALDAAELGVWWNDLTTGVVRFDERGREHYGFQTLETTLDEVVARIHHDDVDRLVAEIAAATDPVSGSGVYATEYRVIPPGEPMRWLSIAVRVLFEGEGDRRRSVVGFGTSADITERKEMEQALRESEEEARGTVERLARAQRLGHMGDWEWDVASGEVRWSDEVYRIYGVSEDFPTTFDAIVPLVHPDDRDMRPAPDAGDPRTIRHGRPERCDSASCVRTGPCITSSRRSPSSATARAGRCACSASCRTSPSSATPSARSSRASAGSDASTTLGSSGVVFWTAEGSITDANDRFLEMLGYSREELDAGEVGWPA